MKKISLSFILFLATFVAAFSQVPNAFNYQAVVRNSSGEILANKTVSFRISLLKNSETGTVVYSETHALSTNEFGLVNLKIGKGTKLSGNFSPADWGEVIFTKVEFDPAGGSSFSTLATTKLSSVPFAFVAQTVVNDKVDDADADATNEIQTMTLTGTLLELSDGGGSVTLPTSGSGGGDNWGAQIVKTNGTLTGNGTTANPLGVVGDGDGDDTNELQTLTKTGNSIQLSDGGGTVTDEVDDADADATNEIQTITLTGTLLELSDGGGSVTLPTSGSSGGDNWGAQTVETDASLTGDGTSTDPLNVVGDLTDDQTLSISGNDLSISGGNTVTLPASESNLWTKTGDDISYNGAVGIGTTDIAGDLSKLTMGGDIHMRNHNINYISQLHFNDNLRFYDDGNDNYLIFKYGDSGYGGIQFNDGNNYCQGYICSDGDNSYPSFGLKDGAGNWTIQVRKSKYTRFLISDSEKMRIESNGNVGIGTTSPDAKLHLIGKIKIADGTQGASKVLTSDADGLASWQTPATGSSSLWAKSGSDIYRSSGRVGIGTTSPTAILDVRNSDPSVASIYTEKVNGWAIHANSYESNGVSVAAMSSGGTAIVAEAAGAGTVKLASTADNAAGYFQGNVYMTSGKVGIGTTSPSEKLHVAGNVLVDENLNIDKDLTVNGGNFDLNSTGENWLSVLRGAGQNAGIAFKESGAAKTQWIFPYFRGWQSDNLIVRNEAKGKDVMTFEAETGNVKVDGKITSTASGDNDMKAFSYGNVKADGTIISGTGNFSVDTGAGTGIYKITFSNESYDIQHFVTTLSISSLSLPKFIQYYSTNGTLVVRIIATDGALSNNDFSFVTYKK